MHHVATAFSGCRQCSHGQRPAEWHPGVWSVKPSVPNKGRIVLPVSLDQWRPNALRCKQDIIHHIGTVEVVCIEDVWLDVA